MRTAALAFIGAFTALAPYANASVYDEFKGLRSDAMGGAHRGLGTSNDTLMLNPAGMLSARRYSVDVLYGFTSFDDLTHISITAVDSKSGPVAGGAGYTHDRGDPNGVDASLHRAYVAAAYPIGHGIGVGMAAKRIWGEFNDETGTRQDVSLYTGDIGLSLMLGNGLGLGATYHNVVRTDFPKLTPPGLGFGAAYSAGPLAIAADLYMDLTDRKDRDISYHVGAEYFASNKYPVRLGYRTEPYVKRDGTEAMENIISGGLGWLSQGGAVELTYSQSLERERNWALTAAIKLFL